MGNDILKCVVFGGGGHGSVVIDCLRQSTKAKLIGILDPGHEIGTTIEGVMVLGGDEAIDVAVAKGASHFICAIGSTGDSSAREKIYSQAMNSGLKPICAIHPSAIIAKSAIIGDGATVFAGAIINPGAEIGENAIINTGAIIEHHCKIGNHAHVATGAVLSGTVRVGRGAHIGSGAVVRHGITIGDGAIVGSGAVVVKNVEDNVTVVGSPARPMGASRNNSADSTST